MSILSFTQWLQSTGWATDLRGSWYVYPVVLTLHVVAIATFGAMILMTNMRLLGLALRGYPISDVIGGLRWPKRVGFLLVFLCGASMASSKAEEYYYNWFFWTKMSLLITIAVHGLIFRRSVYYNTQALDKAPAIPGTAKLAAALSLILWTGVVICGRGIGYIDPPIDKLHAQAVIAPADLVIGRHEQRPPVEAHRRVPAMNTAR
jgi:hypothetical protein